MNKVVLIGRLTKDPELKFTPGTGTAVVQITVAVDRRFKKEGAERETDFIPVVVWGKQAEATANYTAKGKLIGISGRIQTRSYDAKDGTKRYVTEVIAEEVQLLEWAKSSNNQDISSSNSSRNNYDPDLTPVDDGDEVAIEIDEELYDCYGYDDDYARNELKVPTLVIAKE